MNQLAIPSAPPGHWFLGHLPEMRRDILGFFARCERDCGGIVRLRVYATSFYLVSAPELIQDILITQHPLFLKPSGLRAVKPMFGEGLLTSEGEHWQVQRKRIQPAFRRERINRYSEIAASYTQKLLDSWSDGQRRDIYLDMHDLTLDVVSRALFGIDVSAGRSVVTTGTHALQDYFYAWRRHLVPLPSWSPLPSTIKLRRAIRNLDKMVYQLIDRRRASADDGDDLLSSLCAPSLADGSQMSRKTIRDEMVTFFLAGHETTAVSLVWASYLLALHPAVATKLHAEIDTVLKGRTPTVDDLPRLAYLDQVLKEVLRLYPSTYNIGRIAKTKCQVGGYSIGAGTNIIMCQWAVHRSRRYYESPEDFIPERWEPARAGKVPKFAYFPFGAGPRNCVGAQFATMEARIILASIVQRFRLELHPSADVRADAALTLRPLNGLPMVVHERRR